MYPESIEITSTNPLRTELEDRLGVYKKTNKTRNDKPEWRQEDGGKNSFYYDCNGHWFIWPKEQTDLGGFQLRAKVDIVQIESQTQSSQPRAWDIFPWVPRTGSIGEAGQPGSRLQVHRS